MSVTEIPDRPGWYTVIVYDRVQNAGERPKKNKRTIRGQRAAEKVERDLKTARDRGSLSARRQTLSAYAARYLDSRRAEVSRQTLHGYRRIVREYIDRHDIGARPIAKVDATAVSEFYAALLERGSVGTPVSPETVRGVHRILSMILKRATIDGLLHVNPCTVAKPPKVDRPDDEADEPGIDPITAREFLEAVKGTPIYEAAAVALGVGLRRSELLGLRWQDVDLERGQVRVTGKLEAVGGVVERTTTKTKRSRRAVPFGENLAAVFRSQKRRIAETRLKMAGDGLWADEAWVFPSLRVSANRAGELLPAGRMWTPNAFAQEWRQERDRANEIRLAEFVAAGGMVEDFEPWEFGVHALRHCYATAQLAAGVRDEVVSRRMGHSSSLITRKVYSHVTKAERREGVDVVDGLI